MLREAPRLPPKEQPRQVVPTRLVELLADPDPARAAAATQAMLQMGRLVIADLEAAADAAGPAGS